MDGPNLYCHVRQNPWSKFDPEGLALEFVDGTRISIRPNGEKHILENGDNPRLGSGEFHTRVAEYIINDYNPKFVERVESITGKNPTAVLGIIRSMERFKDPERAALFENIAAGLATPGGDARDFGKVNGGRTSSAARFNPGVRLEKSSRINYQQAIEQIHYATFGVGKKSQ